LIEYRKSQSWHSDADAAPPLERGKSFLLVLADPVPGRLNSNVEAVEKPPFRHKPTSATAPYSGAVSRSAIPLIFLVASAVSKMMFTTIISGKFLRHAAA